MSSKPHSYISLRCAIVGITDLYVHEHIDREKYMKTVEELRIEVHRLNRSEDGEGARETSLTAAEHEEGIIIRNEENVRSDASTRPAFPAC